MSQGVSGVCLMLCCPTSLAICDDHCTFATPCGTPPTTLPGRGFAQAAVATLVGFNGGGTGEFEPHDLPIPRNTIRAGAAASVDAAVPTADVVPRHPKPLGRARQAPHPESPLPKRGSLAEGPEGLPQRSPGSLQARKGRIAGDGGGPAEVATRGSRSGLQRPSRTPDAKLTEEPSRKRGVAERTKARSSATAAHEVQVHIAAVTPGAHVPDHADLQGPSAEAVQGQARKRATSGAAARKDAGNAAQKAAVKRQLPAAEDTDGGPVQKTARKRTRADAEAAGLKIEEQKGPRAGILTPGAPGAPVEAKLPSRSSVGRSLRGTASQGTVRRENVAASQDGTHVHLSPNPGILSSPTEVLPAPPLGSLLFAPGLVLCALAFALHDFFAFQSGACSCPADIVVVHCPIQMKMTTLRHVHLYRTKKRSKLMAMKLRLVRICERLCWSFTV